jgi:hypothetical protein
MWRTSTPCGRVGAMALVWLCCFTSEGPGVQAYPLATGLALLKAPLATGCKPPLVIQPDVVSSERAGNRTLSPWNKLPRMGSNFTDVPGLLESSGKPWKQLSSPQLH